MRWRTRTCAPWRDVPARYGGLQAPAKGDLRRDESGGVAVEPADHGLGRSRGGLTTKVHLAVEHGQEPLSFLVTAASGT